MPDDTEEDPPPPPSSANPGRYAFRSSTVVETGDLYDRMPANPLPGEIEDVPADRSRSAAHDDGDDE